MTQALAPGQEQVLPVAQAFPFQLVVLAWVAPQAGVAAPDDARSLPALEQHCHLAAVSALPGRAPVALLELVPVRDVAAAFVVAAAVVAVAVTAPDVEAARLASVDCLVRGPEQGVLADASMLD